MKRRELNLASPKYRSVTYRGRIVYPPHCVDYLTIVVRTVPFGMR